MGINFDDSKQLPLTKVDKSVWFMGHHDFWRLMNQDKSIQSLKLDGIPFTRPAESKYSTPLCNQNALIYMSKEKPRGKYYYFNGVSPKRIFMSAEEREPF